MEFMQFIKTELNDKWDWFVENSPQGSIFSTSTFLLATGYEVDAYYVMKGLQKIAAFVCVVENGNIIQAPHVIHSGIMFGKWNNKNTAQINAIQFEVTEFIVEQITQKYKEIYFNLHPEIIDIRPFSWYNYHNEGRKFRIDIRYTSFIDEPSILDLNTSRKQAICQTGYFTTEEYYPQHLCMLYAAQNGDENIDKMFNIMQALHIKDMLKMYVTRYCGQLGNVIAFSTYKDTATALYSAGKMAECASAGLWWAICSLENPIVNLEGINSPKRGAFKLSFGGSVTPYYQVKLCQN